MRGIFVTMKNKIFKENIPSYPVRKVGLGIASVTLATLTLAMTTDKVHAETTPLDNSNSTVSAAGSQVTNANLIDTQMEETTSGNVKTTTVRGILDPRTNLSSDTNKVQSLTAALTSAQNRSFKTNQGEDKIYSDLQQAGKDYADQINNINAKIAAYDKAVTDYKNSLNDYNVQNEKYESDKAEYEKQLAKYNQKQKDYETAKQQLEQTLENLKNDPTLQNIMSEKSSSGQKEITTVKGDVKIPAELQAAIDEAKAKGILVTENDKQEVESIAQARQTYTDMLDKINQAIAKVDLYNAQKAVFDEAKAKYDKERQAYDEYQAQVAAGQGAGAVVAAQGLIFDQQTKATMTIEGADTYMTKATSDQLNHRDVVSRFDKASLDQLKDENGQRTAYQTTNPNAEDEDTWLILKKGQPVTVTYRNLKGASYNGEAIDHVTYVYTLVSSSDGSDEAMAQILHDPTQTIWVGTNTKSPDQHLTVKMDIAFYDQAGNKIDTSAGNAIISLSSLNHYTTIPYVTEDGKQESIPMNHLERVNIGNNEFILIPGSSITLNEDNWVYALNSNQRKSEGSQFDADDMHAYVNNNDPSDIYVTTNGDKINDNYIRTHGGANNWTEAEKTTGWDALPSATADGKWPVNKFYGAGAAKLTDGTIYFDVSGNTPDFNTSYWFVINSAVAVPRDPGEEPKDPEKPSMEAEYTPLSFVQVESLETPIKPSEPEEPGNQLKEPEVPEVDWHLAKVVSITQETIPKDPEPDPDSQDPPSPTDPEPELRPDPASPESLERPIIIETVETANPKQTEVVSQQVVKEKDLPQTGQKSSSNLITALGAILVSLVSGSFLFKKKRR